ncbi:MULTISPECIES: phosphate signaling complex protein PhoU [unclassified Methanoculleus]|jgi:phosphate transport system protein|uniref:phosphate signaling complex protein PhoU n=1 Tax=unclassified Methanoculleus TaxID=2619537 RepID=UPI0025CEA9BC|nr:MULTISPECIES: phosphate signaling complex protein PhoU [unclassified Methanoculleus]MCK9316795.1 phosphate signaling complex protein PhoU [Methanoculleus sp.]MDD2252744.1 phosphate signaling complex protein PhoU [Methanoculleus sp.]MDD2786467.1 phosphate signaling complex protein PhoU [Methanoculleus sp.]MDD3215273.1 phosphate signaling complex protein PhoU [Methanoculleus sp.]MDD4312987.1 phosphate signaling complex protein PhoU [Methanoculleus sp.]
MVERYHTELASLKGDVLAMGHLAQGMLHQSLEALKTRDAVVVGSIDRDKKRIADYDHDIEQKCLRLIALHQPMAKDLRMIAASMKVITNLYRIGRYGKDIAIVVPDLARAPHVGNLVSIPHMGDLVEGMIADTLIAFEHEDLTAISDIRDREVAVDALRYSVFRECLTYMMEDPKKIAQCTNYVMIARYLERCGDHACKIAEKVHYMVTGDRLEIR